MGGVRTPEAEYSRLNCYLPKKPTWLEPFSQKPTKPRTNQKQRNSKIQMPKKKNRKGHSDPNNHLIATYQPIPAGHGGSRL